MPCSAFSKVLVVALATIVAFAGPGEALAHGEAHHSEHESGPRHAAAAPHDVDFAVSHPGDGHGHRHSQLAGATPSRTEGLTFVVALSPRVPESRLTSANSGTPLQRTPLRRGDPPTGPPPRLRAPPAR